MVVSSLHSLGYKAVKNLFWSCGYDLRRLNREVPSNVVFIIAPRRSGSTWLCDVIRCHPKVAFWPTAIIWELFESRGARYPYDLSENPNGKAIIEIYQNSWRGIPVFSFPLQESDPERINTQKMFSLEKMHPLFFGFDVNAFNQKLNRVRKVKRGIEVKLIYLVRDPKATICSFFNYNKRNSKWGPEAVDNREVIATDMAQCYRCIYEMSQRLPGFILEYRDMKADLSGIVQKMYEYLWPDADQKERDFMQKVSCHAVTATGRKRRAVSGNPFFGKVEGPVKGTDGQYSEFFRQYKVHIDLCYTYYTRLLEKIGRFPSHEEQ